MNRFSRLQQTGNNLEWQFEVAQQISTVETSDVQSHNFVSRLRNLFHLHFSVRTDEQKFGIRKSALDFIGNGDCREDVSSCSAAAHQNAEIPFFPKGEKCGCFYVLFVFQFFFFLSSLWGFRGLGDVVNFFYTLLFAHSFFIIYLDS